MKDLRQLLPAELKNTVCGCEEWRCYSCPPTLAVMFACSYSQRGLLWLLDCDKWSSLYVPSLWILYLIGCAVKLYGSASTCNAIEVWYSRQAGHTPRKYPNEIDILIAIEIIVQLYTNNVDELLYYNWSVLGAITRTVSFRLIGAILRSPSKYVYVSQCAVCAVVANLFY